MAKLEEAQKAFLKVRDYLLKNQEDFALGCTYLGKRRRFPGFDSPACFYPKKGQIKEYGGGKMKLTNQERKAVKTALELLGYYDVAESEGAIQEWLADDTISICTCRSARTVIWILTDRKEICIYIDTLETLTDAEIKKELM